MNPSLNESAERNEKRLLSFLARLLCRLSAITAFCDHAFMPTAVPLPWRRSEGVSKVLLTQRHASTISTRWRSCCYAKTSLRGIPLRGPCISSDKSTLDQGKRHGLQSEGGDNSVHLFRFESLYDPLHQISSLPSHQETDQATGP